ncbi:glycosyltransferase family 4 protein [Formosa haliotis]|uniref:glycosyltransferase family 4 protein n=1 Tax=Formosa haliotis TaxID=1555194 RepID=UPI000825A4C5|nr:glycosyltransferase family 4 protein [Formosa haliotis]
MEHPKKKILIFIDWFLPGTRSGGPVRSYANLIAHFKDEFEFLIVTRDTDYCENEPYKAITSNSWNSINDNTKVYYISNDQLNKQTIKSLIAETTFDIGYINGIYSLNFSILPLYYLKKSNMPVVVAARGMLNPQAFSVKKGRKKMFLKLAKQYGLYKNIMFHATNEAEKQHIINNTGNSNVLVAANLPRLISDENSKRQKLENVAKMVCIARISREKGTHHILHALIPVEDATIILDLYGPIYDSVYWDECKEIIKKLPKSVTVTHKGVIDGDEVPNVIRDYEFLVLLSEGENFGHAILEGLSAGCPVIISDQTPWRDLESKSIGWDLPLKDTNSITEVLIKAAKMDADSYKEWSEAAYNYAKVFCENPEVLEANRQLFN